MKFLQFSTKSFTKKAKVLNLNTINHNILKAEYQVRGTVVIKAEELRKEIEKGKKMKFDNFLGWNIGNPQILGQKPITFPREVISYLLSDIQDESKTDAERRADKINKHVYNIDSSNLCFGVSYIRKSVAKFIEKRDKHPANYHNIFLTNGASSGIKTVLQAILTDPHDAALAPIPQYPLYSATIDLLGSSLIGYQLDESNKWSIHMDELTNQYNTAVKKGKNVKTMVIINPGNPTGNVLSHENILQILEFCEKRNIIVLADEVYQENIYDPSKHFHSFKKVLSEYKIKVPLASFHSTSKGYIGECGMRGGYTELVNFDEDLKKIIFNLRYLEGPPNISGQLILHLLVSPPDSDSVSISTLEKYEKEVESIKKDLQEKAIIMTTELNKMERIECNTIEGAMYAFPKIDIPQKAKDLAFERNIEPDLLYCLELLDETGIIAVPGSGFGQKEGTFHVRLTNLICPQEKLRKTVELFKDFNKKFMEKYS